MGCVHEGTFSKRIGQSNQRRGEFDSGFDLIIQLELYKKARLEKSGFLFLKGTREALLIGRARIL